MTYLYIPLCGLFVLFWSSTGAKPKLDSFSTFASRMGVVSSLFSRTFQSQKFRFFRHFVIDIVLKTDRAIGIRCGQQHFSICIQGTTKLFVYACFSGEFISLRFFILLDLVIIFLKLVNCLAECEGNCRSLLQRPKKLSNMHI